MVPPTLAEGVRLVTTSPANAAPEVSEFAAWGSGRSVCMPRAGRAAAVARGAVRGAAGDGRLHRGLGGEEPDCVPDRDGDTVHRCKMKSVDRVTELYRQIDPLRPLRADEVDLFVDWPGDLMGPDDVKKLLVRAFARSGDTPITRLFTGHRGTGKTTELYRVPLVVSGRTYAWSALAIIAAASASGLIVAWRARRLDLIAVLKTRE